MTRQDWREIEEAAALLGLGEAATWGEIRRAYHERCKLRHPDVAGETPENAEQMRRLALAYERLKNHCETWRFPLTPSAAGGDLYDPQEWWRARFGQEPAWNSGAPPRKR